jgi:hypothetical protein
MHATCIGYLTLLDWFILIILVKSAGYEAPHFAVFLQPPTISFLFGPHILLNTLFSDALTL